MTRTGLSVLGRRCSAVMVLVLVPALVEAQRSREAARRPLPPAAVGQRPRVQNESLAPGRARLEAEVRRNFARVVKQGVGLSDAQMQRLAPVTQRHEQQRRQLQLEERDARLALRAALRDEATADPRHVDQLLQKLLDVQKRRLSLLESEQRELGAFMTPIQRAKFMAMQEQMRRRLEQMRQRRVP